MEPKICTEMLKKLSEKLRAKFSATTRGYSIARITRLDDAFSECFELEASPVEGQSLQQKEKKGERGKAKKKSKRIEKLKSNFDFCACPSKNVLKRDATGKKDMLSCCKCLFE